MGITKSPVSEEIGLLRACSLHLFPYAFERTFFQAGNLCLRDMDFIGDFHLGAPFKETKI